MSGKNWHDCKLAIGLCNNQRTVPSEFFWNFLSIAKPVNTVVLRGRSRLKAASLNRIVEEAAWRKAEKILFMDIDQTFPAHTIPRLLSRELPIVSGLTYTVDYPYSPAAGWLGKKKDGNGERFADKFECVNHEGRIWKNHYAPFPDNERHLVQVDWVGISCLLVDMDVFNHIYFPCFKEVWDDEIGDRITGHDILFCDAVRDAGYSIFVDTTVQCGHIGEVVINDLYVKSYHQSNIYQTEYDVLKDAAQGSAYWDEQYIAESVMGISRAYQKEWDMMISLIPPGSSVLEMGCGTGNLMELMRKNGFSVHGYDFSMSAIEEAKRKSLSAELADLRTIKPNGKLYDVVISSHVLEHMKDDTGFLKTCMSFLNSYEGKVIVSVPLMDNHPVSLMEHQHNYTEETLKETMSYVFSEVNVIPFNEPGGKPSLIAVGTKPHGIRLHKGKDGCGSSFHTVSR